MKFFKSPLFIAVLTVFLGVFFISIIFMQSKNTPTVENKPNNTVSQKVEPKAGDETKPTTSTPISFAKVEEKTTTEKQQVLVSFVNENNQAIAQKEVPLYEITKVEKGSEPAKIVSVVANGELAKSLIDDIKLPNEKHADAKIIKTDSKFEKIVSSGSGLEVDKEKTLQELEKSIQSNAVAKKFDKIDVKIITKKNEGFSEKMNEMGFKTLLAKFRTTHPGHIDDA